MTRMLILSKVVIMFTSIFMMVMLCNPEVTWDKQVIYIMSIVSIVNFVSATIINVIDKGDNHER